MDLLDDECFTLNSSLSGLMVINLPPPPMDTQLLGSSDDHSAVPESPSRDHTSVEEAEKSLPKQRPQRRSRKKRRNEHDDEDFDLQENDDDDEDEFRPSDAADTAAAKGSSSRSVQRKRSASDLLGNSVVLSRDVLLTISSEEYDDLVSRLTERRPLTEAEKKEVRRQKRLIKNRESAAQSRNRKKQALESLADENARLKKELEAEKSKWSAVESILAGMGQLEAVLKQIGAPLGGSNRRQAGVGLMFIFLLSFSLFASLPMFGASMPGAPSSSLESSKMFEDYSNVANLRKLMSVDNHSHLLDLPHECWDDGGQLIACPSTSMDGN